MRILDVGCGSGRNLVYLLQSGYEVFGIDPDPISIQVVQRLASKLAPQIPPDNFRVESIEKTTFPQAFGNGRQIRTSRAIETVGQVPVPVSCESVIEACLALEAREISVRSSEDFLRK